MYYVNNYLRPNTDKDYVPIIEKLLTLNDTDEIFTYLDSFSYDKRKIRNSLTPYLLEFRPDIVLDETRYKDLLSFYRKMLTEYYLERYEARELKSNIDKEKLAIARKYVYLYLESKYTIERFCMQQRITKVQFTKETTGFIYTIKRFDEKLFQEFLRVNEERNADKEKHIQEDIEKILNYIKEHQEETKSIDIYSLTIYGPREIIEVARNILGKDDLILLSTYLNKFKGSFYYNNVTFLTDASIEGFINTPYTITLNNEEVELTKEDKEYIIDILYQNGVPATNITIDEMVKDVAKKKIAKNK